MLVYFLNDFIDLKMKTISAVAGHELLKEGYNPGTIVLCGILEVTVWQIHEVILLWCNSYWAAATENVSSANFSFPLHLNQGKTPEIWKEHYLNPDPT